MRALTEIRRSHNLTSRQIAQEAQITLTDEYLFEIGAHVDKQIALNLVIALNNLTQGEYTLDDIEGVANEAPMNQNAGA